MNECRLSSEKKRGWSGYIIMSGSNGYKTKQRDLILNYMTTHRNAHVTVAGISDHLASCGTPIGTATIYRQLEKLVEQGVVRKYTVDSATCACFQYVEPDRKCHEHFHLKCEKCGRLIHLECGFVSELSSHVQKEHGFTIDPLRTVFYGVCRECSEQGEKLPDGKEENNE